RRVDATGHRARSRRVARRALRDQPAGGAGRRRAAPARPAAGPPDQPRAARPSCRGGAGARRKEALRALETRPQGTSVLTEQHQGKDGLAAVAGAGEGLEPDQRRNVLAVAVADVDGEANLVALAAPGGLVLALDPVRVHGPRVTAVQMRQPQKAV